MPARVGKSAAIRGTSRRFVRRRWWAIRRRCRAPPRRSIIGRTHTRRLRLIGTLLVLGVVGSMAVAWVQAGLSGLGPRSWGIVETRAVPAPEGWPDDLNIWCSSWPMGSGYSVTGEPRASDSSLLAPVPRLGYEILDELHRRRPDGLQKPVRWSSSSRLLYAVQVHGWPRPAWAYTMSVAERDGSWALQRRGGVAIFGEGSVNTPRARPAVVLPVLPIWRGVAVNALVCAAALWLLWLVPGAVRRGLRRRAGRCVRCGYDVRGLERGQPCPECGGGAGGR